MGNHDTLYIGGKSIAPASHVGREHGTEGIDIYVEMKAILPQPPPHLPKP